MPEIMKRLEKQMEVSNMNLEYEFPAKFTMVRLRIKY